MKKQASVCKFLFRKITNLVQCLLIHPLIRGLSERYPSILNISRTRHVALRRLDSQSEETLLHIREQSLFRGASQSAVRRR